MLFKKMVRTLLNYKAQFISMIIMITLGVGVFVGFNMEWYTISVDTSNYYESTNLADYKLIREKGFSEEDYKKVEEIDGVDLCSRVLQLPLNVKNGNQKLELNVYENTDFLKLYYVDGKEYSSDSDGIFLSDKYALANNISLGDEITLTYKRYEITVKVDGLVKTSDYMVCVGDESQLMPDYNVYGYFFITPNKFKELLGFNMYTSIYIKSNLEKKNIENKLYDSFSESIMLLDKNENISYSASSSEIEEGQTMGAILPVLFLAIGILTMITTMHRITANDKVQIGTLKALGFKDRRITAHYTLYGLFIGAIGSILGVGIGYAICAVIMNPNGMMGTYFDLPFWDKQFPWFCYVVIAGVNLLLTFVSYLSVRKMLKGCAADALKPFSPKKMKPLLMEKTKLWNKLSFATRWNLRDIFRNKARTGMSLVGVIGCMVLLVSGLGMKSTMNLLMSNLENKIMTYETKVNFAEDITNQDAYNLKNQYNGDLVASMMVKLDDDPVSLEVYDATNELIQFIDTNDNNLKLNNDGAYICKRIADLGYSVGDTIIVDEYGTNNKYSITIVGIYKSISSKAIIMNKEYADIANISYKFTSLFTNENEANIASNDLISSTQNKADIISTYNTFNEVINTMVLLLIICSLVLGVVVLYNLGVMSYIERYRELSTLKVVGFKDKRISNILISQNIWITVLGIILGLPAGYFTIVGLCNALGSEYELTVYLGPLAYIISITLTFGVSLIVSFFIARKNKYINMVESLKGLE